ncbi:MAG TPA: 2-C-methyl-D-erythritol 4-phosphate cytidylyltransferase, partial [Planctomycetota bacterium]|nr:2-C-methyl-D-erythritol 4-phosphate cytidylyltransferase [Planctomycetota bacterium]
IAAARTCLQRAAEVGAALLAVPAPDTLKRVVDGRVRGTFDRDGIWLAQTPQVVRRELLARALQRAAADGFAATDDVSLVEHLDGEVAVVAGSPTNLKLTTAADLPLVEALCALEQQA